jgi:asparagine synthase (glutamine-hydrolysing)
MCGIAGFIGFDRDRVHDSVQRMTTVLAHRGPDAQGVEVVRFGHVWLGLGHRRLAILDLSPLGQQPMTHAKTGSKLIYNGEIYNFLSLRKELESLGESFVSQSDTEVLLAALVRWGEQALNKLQGMFAFAFYDAAHYRLLLARDSVGIKPLYYARTSVGLVFASEVRGVLASGALRGQLSLPAIAGYLAYGAVQQPLTIYSDIEAVPPGSWIEISEHADGWKVGQPRRFWEYPRATTPCDTQAAIGSMRTLLDQAVRDHLVSDVPVGVFLSSGVDSAAIAGFAARHSPQIRTFTVGFSDHPAWSEATQATELAKRLKLDHTVINLHEQDALTATQEWLNRLDQPSIDGLNVFVISQAVRNEGIKVALSGLGSDELFGGYPSFSDVPRLWRVMGWIRWLPSPLRRCLAKTLSLRLPVGTRAKLVDMASGPYDLLSLCLQRRRLMSNQQLERLGLRADDLGLDFNFQPSGANHDLKMDETDLIWSISVVESRYYQGNMLLPDCDVNGMAHGLEIRVPFLDQRLLDFAHAIPGPVRLPPGDQPKYLLREAVADIVQPDRLNHAKRGFTLPTTRWMMGTLRPRCESAIEQLKQLGLLRPEGIDAVWKAFTAQPDTPIWTRALALVVLGSFFSRSHMSPSLAS